MNNVIRFALQALALWVLASTTQAANEMYFVHTDHLGTPQVLTDSDQQVVWEAKQTPFGELVSEQGAATQPLRFPGQYADPETGFSYNYFRDYDSTIGRYVQSDPIGLAGGLNTYGYVYQNPLSYSDRYGLEVNLQTHPVALGFDHAKITVVPYNQKKWASHSRFDNNLPNGDAYITFGAGPSAGIFGGILINGLNRDRDLYLSHNTSSQSVFGQSCPMPEYEDKVIESLLEAHDNYLDNLDYEFFPQSWTDGYNSNSYISGLLGTGNFSFSPPSGVPGFEKPVPLSNFGRQP